MITAIGDVGTMQKIGGLENIGDLDKKEKEKAVNKFLKASGIEGLDDSLKKFMANYASFIDEDMGSLEEQRDKIKENIKTIKPILKKVNEDNKKGLIH